MEARTGTVSKVSEREWYDSRAGRNVILHSFQLQGDRGWYRTGQKREVSEGEYISFVVGPNSAAKDIQRQTPPANAPAASSAPRVSAGGGRDGYWEAREARDVEKEQRYQAIDVPRMVYQAAQERAIALVDLAVRTESITLPTKKADRLDVLIGLVDEVAQTLAGRAFVAHEILQEQRGERPEATQSDEGEEE